jgi:catechol 2,3-dioxygenase-like lactoylglutathione lyase family enzyme
MSRSAAPHAAVNGSEDPLGAIDLQKLCQVCIVVRDIEASAKRYSELFGVAMPEIFSTPSVDIAHTVFQGETTPTRARLAVFHVGSMVLELLEPDDEPSSWRDFLEKHGEGVHHIGFGVDDLPETLRVLGDQGITERHSGDYPGGRYVTVDSAQQLGVLLNLKIET